MRKSGIAVATTAKSAAKLSVSKWGEREKRSFFMGCLACG
jgi:hypothetical protein